MGQAMRNREMMQTANFFVPTKSFHFPKGNVEQKRCDGRPIFQTRCKTEPENRLWKLSMVAGSGEGRRLELIAFLFFGVLASAAAVYCGAEVFNVINNGALEQTVQVLLTR
jgi:hypothetical protein